MGALDWLLPGTGALDWLLPGDGELERVLVGDATGAATTSAVAVPVTTVTTGRRDPITARVTVADRVAVSPAGAEPGTRAWACRATSRFGLSMPSAQVCVPSPALQSVKVGEGKRGDGRPGRTAIWTVTSPGGPPACQTRSLYRAACPGSTVPVAVCRRRHSFAAAAGGDGEVDAGGEGEVEWCLVGGDGEDVAAGGEVDAEGDGDEEVGADGAGDGEVDAGGEGVVDAGGECGVWAGAGGEGADAWGEGGEKKAAVRIRAGLGGDVAAGPASFSHWVTGGSLAAECATARAAAATPPHRTAIPADAAMTKVPARFAHRGTLRRYPVRDINSRLSAIAGIRPRGPLRFMIGHSRPGAGDDQVAGLLGDRTGRRHRRPGPVARAGRAAARATGVG